MESIAILPQVWGPDQLRAHYPGWSDRRMRRELRQRVNLRMTRGSRLAVDLSDVQEVDRQLAADAARRRSKAPATLRVVEGGTEEPNWMRVLGRSLGRKAKG